jgi:hypothetical protein
MSRPVHLSISGSAARDDGDTASDIEIFVVRPRDVADDDPALARAARHDAITVTGPEAPSYSEDAELRLELLMLADHLARAAGGSGSELLDRIEL